MARIINACPKGHRYSVSGDDPRQSATCPRCDRHGLVALAYGDCQNPPRACRLLTFLSEPISDYDEFCQLIALAGRYNAFDPQRVAAEIRPLFPRLLSVEFGREASPVLYIRLPHWTHQSIGWEGTGMGERIPDPEQRALAKAVVEAMRRAEADELTAHSHVVRAWWD